jgi:REP element-mobilizing transposase RayT
LFKLHPEIKKILWGGHFWTSGFYINTVGQYGNETTIKNYVHNQGRKYQQIERKQLSLFEDTPA